jgi:DNA-binding HxlR family transcriptional regulator
MRDEVITTALEELENAGLVERTGEIRWGERSGEWQPVYTLTELGRALSQTGIAPHDYLNGCKN